MQGAQAGWAFESLDLQWAHAIAPDANLVLVATNPAETQGVQGLNCMFNGESWAIQNFPGAVLSQSFATTEQSFHSAAATQVANFDKVYQDAVANRVTVLGASGDSGTANPDKQGRLFPEPTVNWPSSDPLVTSAGGTWLQYGWKWNPTISANDFYTCLNTAADSTTCFGHRTVYQYFPTVEQLLLDATLGLLSQAAVDEAIEAADADGDATDRVAAMVRALSELSAETLPLGRSLIRLTIEEPAGGLERPRRGYRRIGWIERALEPLRSQLEDEVFERLVSALAMVVGWEALIVMQDLRGLSPAAQTDTSLWAARALIRAALDDQPTDSAPQPTVERSTVRRRR